MKNVKHKFVTLPLLVSAVSIGAMTQAIASRYDAQSAWKLQSDKEGGYCSSSQKFNDKVYITFAKRTDGAMSLAVDFQKETLSVSGTHAFKVKSGTVSRSFKLQPTSPNAIVFPLGEDEPLINAMIETSVLTLSIDDEAYDFTLKNPQDLKSDLYGCVASIAPAEPVAVTSADTDSVSDLDKLKEENRRLSNMLTELRRSADDRVAAMAGNARAEEAKEKVFVLEQENTRLQSELTSLPALKDVAASVDTLKADLELSKTEQSALQEKLASANTQILALESEKQEAATATSAAVENELLALKSEKETLEKRVEEGVEALRNAETQLLDTQEKLTMSEAKIVDLNGALELNNKEISKLETVTNDSEADAAALADIQDKLAMSEAKVADLNSVLELNRKEISRLEAVSSENEGGTVELKTLQEKLLKELNDKDQKLAEKTTALEALTSEKKGLLDKITSLDTQLAAKSDSNDNNAVINVLNEKVAGLTSENKAHLATIEELSSAVKEAPKVAEPDTAMLDQLKGELTGKETKISELEAEILELKGELTQQVADAKLLEAKEGEYGMLERRHKTALVDIEAIKAQNIDLEDQVIALEKKIIEYKTANKKIELAADASWDLEKATRRYQEAQREIVSLGRMIEKKDQQCDMAKKDIEQLLFDPEIAASEQRAKLAQLESEIVEKNILISQLESGQMAAQPKQFVERVELVEPTVIPAATEPSVTIEPIAAPEPKPEPKIVEVVELAEAAPQIVSETPKAQERTGYMKTLISKAGFSSNVEEQEKGDMKILRWKNEGLHGTGVEKPLLGQTLSQAVNAYIDRAQSKCSGDFAAVPSLQGDTQQNYEIACVKPDGTGSSASLLFLQEQQSMITIAHEGRTELMDQAIEARDEIGKVVQN